MARRHDCSVTSLLMDRQLIGGAVRLRPFLREFECSGGCSGTITTNASGSRSSPVFGLKYATVYTKLLAMADEDGYVSIVNTALPPPATLDDDGPGRASAQWAAHRNAVFELSWASNDAWMYTASGDMTLALWDTAYAGTLARFRGHTGSVKAISVSPFTPHVVASGGRDGQLLLWDCRSPAVATAAHGAAHQPVARIAGAHASARPAGRGRQKPPLQGRPLPSVTSLQFLPCGSGHALASGGVDGAVRLWDVRSAGEAAGALPADGGGGGGAPAEWAGGASLGCLASSPVPRLGVREHAITALALHPDGAQLLVSLTGGHHLLYSVARPDAGPLRWYGGHTVTSFYVKAAFSPDGSHFISGSSDGGAYLWQVEQADGAAPYVLHGHDREVTATAWCPTDSCQVATAADDCTVKVWNVQRRQQPEARDEPPRGALARGGTPHAAERPMAVTSGCSPALPGGAASARDEPASCEGGPSALLQRDASTPAASAAAASASAGGSASVWPSTGVRVSNVLQAIGQGPRHRRSKQQTLAQVLGAARAARDGGVTQGDAVAQAPAKRAKRDAGPRGPEVSAEARRPSSAAHGSGRQDENASPVAR